MINRNDHEIEERGDGEGGQEGKGKRDTITDTMQGGEVRVADHLLVGSNKNSSAGRATYCPQ